jgi:hypothetical protein
MKFVHTLIAQKYAAVYVMVVALFFGAVALAPKAQAATTVDTSNPAVVIEQILDRANELTQYVTNRSDGTPVTDGFGNPVTNPENPAPPPSGNPDRNSFGINSPGAQSQQRGGATGGDWSNRSQQQPYKPVSQTDLRAMERSDITSLIERLTKQVTERQMEALQQAREGGQSRTGSERTRSQGATERMKAACERIAARGVDMSRVSMCTDFDLESEPRQERSSKTTSPNGVTITVDGLEATLSYTNNNGCVWYEIDWGDDTTDEKGDNPAGRACTMALVDVEVSHEYETAGTYTIKYEGNRNGAEVVKVGSTNRSNTSRGGDERAGRTTRTVSADSVTRSELQTMNRDEIKSLVDDLIARVRARNSN